MQTLSGLSGRLSQGESDLTLPPGRPSEAMGGYDSFCRSPYKGLFQHSRTSILTSVRTGMLPSIPMADQTRHVKMDGSEEFEVSRERSLG